MNRFFVAYCLVASLSTSLSADETPEPRWEKDIRSLEAKWNATAKAPGGVLFVGSSSIRLWDLKKSFPDLVATNHGFGGSQMSDSVEFFDRIVVSVKPRVIVVYAGDNDIASGESPETVRDDTERFFKLVEERLPDCERVVYIAIKPSVKRWSMKDQQVAANTSINKLCTERGERFVFLDIWEPMLDDNGEPRPDLLVDDGLHLNDAGYELWSRLLRPHLE